MLSCQSCLTLYDPMGCNPTRLLCPWDFPGENTGVGCYFLPQGIFLIQRSRLPLLHCQVDSLPLGHMGSPVFSPLYFTKFGKFSASRASLFLLAFLDSDHMNAVSFIIVLQVIMLVQYFINLFFSLQFRLNKSYCFSSNSLILFLPISTTLLRLSSDYLKN